MVSVCGLKFTSTTKPPPGIVTLVGKLKSMPLRMRQVFAGFVGSKSGCGVPRMLCNSTNSSASFVPAWLYMISLMTTGPIFG